MAKEPLPQPVLDPAKRSKIKVNENHGLWAFFNKEKRSLTKPEDENAHGLPFIHCVVKRKGADERFPKVDPGQWRSYGISPLKIYIVSGGFV